MSKADFCNTNTNDTNTNDTNTNDTKTNDTNTNDTNTNTDDTNTNTNDTNTKTNMSVDTWDSCAFVIFFLLVALKGKELVSVGNVAQYRVHTMQCSIQCNVVCIAKHIVVQHIM